MACRNAEVPCVSLLVPCSFCESRQKGKNAWLAWAWNRADNERVAYKQRLCLDCFAANAYPLLMESFDDVFQCPVCHSDPGDQLDPVYLTYIYPGSPKAQAEFALCGPCAVEVRIRAQKGSQLLEDKADRVGAAAPTTPATSGWDALGLRPRD